ncbi:hypothetical protein LTR37_001570 [Vermiconidia calcicola]|uniref:Uncharacterized protein n=1 Tax=Vermiconidia calcicola TaxID=1690605 RepID=A0ACC3NV36_9PEZI|nr:hypothetical protein LTR37_001570 [Vermiconidia calcicola]
MDQSVEQNPLQGSRGLAYRDLSIISIVSPSYTMSSPLGTFQRFPREVRDIIYTHYLAEQTAQVVLRHSITWVTALVCRDHDRFLRLPTLVGASRALYNEVTSFCVTPKVHEANVDLCRSSIERLPPVFQGAKEATHLYVRVAMPRSNPAIMSSHATAVANSRHLTNTIRCFPNLEHVIVQAEERSSAHALSKREKDRMISTIEDPLTRLRNLKSITAIVMPGANFQRVTADSRHGWMLANYCWQVFHGGATTDLATHLAEMHVDWAVQEEIRPKLEQGLSSI